jgi:hypothetical protein
MESYQQWTRKYEHLPHARKQAITRVLSELFVSWEFVQQRAILKIRAHDEKDCDGERWCAGPHGN